MHPCRRGHLQVILCPMDNVDGDRHPNVELGCPDSTFYLKTSILTTLDVTQFKRWR
jgi:hypothetical protein